MSLPRRVAYVVKRYPRYSETFIVNEILAHEAAGLEVFIFALNPPVDTHFQGAISRVRAPVTYLSDARSRASAFWEDLQCARREVPGLWTRLGSIGAPEVREVWQAAKLAVEFRRRGIDHVHAHFATAAASVAGLASRLGGFPFTLTAHAKDIFHESVDDAELEAKIRAAAAVVTVSDFNLDYLRRKFGTAVRIERIYNGLDLSGFCFELPLDRPPSILGVGRLVEKKGFADLIDACELLKRWGQPFRCDIVGAGELEADLRTRIDQRGLQHEVSLLGPRPQQEVMARMREASVFAAPCVVASDGNRDGLPTVLLEAMALGTPCVSTGVTGIPEVARHERTALLVNPGAPEELARALQRLINDGDLRLELATRARELIEVEFDIRRNASALRELFRGATRRPAEVV